MNTNKRILYFFTFSLMHYCVFVMIPADCDAETAVDESLAPFDESLEVELYRVHLHHDEVRRMAAHYGIEPASLHALAAKMPDWANREGGVDRDGLYYLSTCNPDGYWDWYEIGGRWDVYVPRSRNNTIQAGSLAASGDLGRCLPYYVLTPEGDWLEHERCYSAGDWKTFTKEALPEADWLHLVRETLGRWPDHRVVCVDIHS